MSKSPSFSHVLFARRLARLSFGFFLGELNDSLEAFGGRGHGPVPPPLDPPMLEVAIMMTPQVTGHWEHDFKMIRRRVQLNNGSV